MGGIIGGKTSIHTSEPMALGIRVQTSAYGLPIPIVYGRNRVSGNVIWYGDFTAIPHTTTTSSGGKGGSVESSNTTYSYTVGLQLALCEGPITAVNNHWSNKNYKTGLGPFSQFLGTYPQSPWSHLTVNHPGEAIGYQGTAHVDCATLDLGGSPSLPNHTFDVTGALPYAVGSGLYDADPKVIIQDFLTNSHYGAGFPAAKLGDHSAYSDYCVATGLLLSPVYNTQKAANEAITALARLTNAGVYFSEGLLKITPYGDTSITGNGVTYTPNVTPVYDLTDDDFLTSGDEPPVRMTRTPQADAYNQVLVEFVNRDKQYNVEIAEAKDQVGIDVYGLRPMETVTAHEIADAAVARRVAQILLQRSQYIRNTYEFTLSWRYCLLEPTDYVTLTDSGLGLVDHPVRILTVEEDENGKLTMTAEDAPAGVSSDAAYPSETGGGATINYNVSPGNANAPVIFEPPLALSGTPQLWLATSGGADWGGAEVWVSLDDATYKRVGTLYGGARHGALTAALPVGSDPDVANTLAVDLTISAGQLLSGTLDDRDLYNTLCYAGGELVSYQTASLTSAFHYDLTSLRRGVYGTAIDSHVIGAEFARLDEAIFRYAYSEDYLGQLLYIKLRSFNKYGGAIEDLSGLTPVTYTIVGGQVGVVTGFALAQPWIGTTVSVKWDAYRGASHYKMEVYAGAVLRRTVNNITDTAFDYTIEDSRADGGPYRALELRVYAMTSTGQSTAAAILTPSNPQFTAADITGLSIVGAPGQINIQADRPASDDYAGTIIWAGDAAGFTLDAAHVIYDGPTPFYVYPIAGGTTKHIRLAHYDIFGQDSLDPSTDATATSILAGGVPTVDTQPAGTYLGTSPLYDVVYYGAGATPDFKLYRWNGSAYVTWVDGSDLLASSVTAGKITTIDLAAISANLGTITAGNITLDSSGFIKGGATGYLTGAGFWQGYHSGAYKWHVGNPAGEFMAWTGTALTVQSSQFTLSGGVATFSGSLSAASGTFAGNLSAAGGTFAGTLTAAAVNAVNTINIAGYAVTVPASVTTQNVTLNSSTWTTVTQIQVDARNNGLGAVPVYISAFSFVSLGAQGEQPIYVPFSFSVSDSPGEVNQWYYVQMIGEVEVRARILRGSTVIIGGTNGIIVGSRNVGITNNASALSNTMFGLATKR